MQRGWWAVLLIAIALVPALILLIFDDSDDSAHSLHVSTRPVVVGDIDTVPAADVVGSPIEMLVRVAADRPIPIDRLVVQLRNQNGSSTELTPESGRTPGRIGTGELMAVPMSGTVREAGKYTYNLKYHSAGVWHDLPPYGTLAVNR